MFKPKFSRKFKKPVSLRKRSKSPRSVPKSVKAYVSRAITRKAEHKMLTLTGFTPGIPFTTLSSANVSNISPQCSQGVGVNARIGNKIRIVSVKMRYVLTFNWNQTTGNPYYNIPMNVRLFIGHTIDSPSIAPGTSDLSQLLKSGATAVSFDSSLLALLRPINKYVWAISKQKIWKVGNASAPTTGTAGAGTFYNNDYKSAYIGTMDITKSYLKNCVYEDALNLPYNTGTYMFLGVSDESGSSYVYALPTVGLNYEVDIIYTDE